MHTVPRARPRGMTRESVGRGRSFCAVVTGPEEAAGQTVDVKGHAVSLKPGKCSPLMMGGKPFLEQKPKDMQTSNDLESHGWERVRRTMMDVATTKQQMSGNINKSL